MSENTNGNGKWRVWIAIVLLLFPFVFLTATARSDLARGDSAELTSAAIVMGIPHATGYPLYVWIGRLATLLPGPGPDRAMNLLSAFLGACAILFFALAGREVIGRILPAATAMAGLALARPYWFVSTVAEVYSLHLLFTALTLFALFRWKRTGDYRLLLLAVYTAALGVTHHGSAAIFAPGYALFVIANRRLVRNRARLLLPLLFAPLLFTVYLHHPIRNADNPPINSFHDIRERIDLGILQEEITGDTFRDHFLYKLRGIGPARKLEGFGETAVKNIATLPSYFRATLGILLLIFGPIGLVWGIARGMRGEALLLAYGFVVNTIFYINFRSFDLEDFFLPSALFLALGAALLFGEAERASDRWKIRAVYPAAAFLLLFTLNGADLVMGAEKAKRFRHVPPVLNMERKLISRDFPEHSRICVSWGRRTVLNYLQITEDLRPDLRFHSIGKRWYVSVAKAWLDKAPLFVDRPTPELKREFKLTPIHTLTRVELADRD